MGEFAEAAEAVVSAESAAVSEAPSAAPDVETVSDSPPATDDTPASDPAVSGDSTDAPPVAALPQTAATRDGRGRFAGKQPGPPSTIPYSRFQEVTQKAKQRETEVQALKERFGWIGENEAPVFKQFWEAYKADPASAFLNELPLLLNSPKYGQRMREALTEMIGPKATAAITQQEPENEEEPKPDRYFEHDDGTRTWLYSAEQMAKRDAWREKQQEKTLAPIKSYIEQAQAREAYGRMTVAAKQSARQLIDGLKSSPYFEPHKAAIRERFQKYAAQYTGEHAGERALHRAYAEVLQEVVIPSMSSADRRALATSLQAKTGASSPNPARPGLSTGGAKPPSSFAEAAERVLAGQR